MDSELPTQPSRQRQDKPEPTVRMARMPGKTAAPVAKERTDTEITVAEVDQEAAEAGLLVETMAAAVAAVVRVGKRDYRVRQG